MLSETKIWIKLLGLNISKIDEGIELSQPHYFEKILKKCSQFDDAPSKAPRDSIIHLKNIKKRVFHS